jgi:hypothetical protein
MSGFSESLGGGVADPDKCKQDQEQYCDQSTIVGSGGYYGKYNGGDGVRHGYPVFPHSFVMVCCWFSQEVLALAGRMSCWAGDLLREA